MCRCAFRNDCLGKSGEPFLRGEWMVMLWRQAESIRTDAGRNDKNRCCGKARLESDKMVDTHDKNFRI